MKKLLLSISLMCVASVLAIGATTSYFSDTEVSGENTFTAGTLDLKLDGGDSDIVKFNVGSMRPGSQPKGTFRLMNLGTLPGELILSGVIVTDFENVLTEPEIAAGDTTGGALEGELSSVVNLRIFHDINKDGWISTGEPVVFNSKVNNLSAPIVLMNNIASMDEQNFVFIFDWWNTADDNMAQGDSFTLDLEFTLQQI